MSKSIEGGTRSWTKDLSICSRLLYHWAIPPLSLYVPLSFTMHKISFFLSILTFFTHVKKHCWCSGIIQDSHSWDLGSIPRQCIFIFFYCKTKLKLVCTKITIFQQHQGAPGFEPGTSRSAVECSTTELHPLTWPQNYLNYFPIPNSIQVAKILIREHPDLNWGPIDLQSIALPLSYTPLLWKTVQNSQ